VIRTRNCLRGDGRKRKRWKVNRKREEEERMF
jgi:hypothetical protein